MKRAWLLLIPVVVILPACSAEQLSRNVYEGARVYDESLKSTPIEQSKGDAIPYDQYEKERQKSSSGGGE